jgi:hypothetical protein
MDSPWTRATSLNQRRLASPNIANTMSMHNLLVAIVCCGVSSMDVSAFFLIITLLLVVAAIVIPQIQRRREPRE